MYGMALRAGHIGQCMAGSPDVGAREITGVAGQTGVDDLRGRHERKSARDCGFSTASLYVSLSRPVAALAARAFRGFLAGRDALEVGVFIEIQPDVRVTSPAHIAADESRCICLRRRGQSRQQHDQYGNHGPRFEATLAILGCRGPARQGRLARLDNRTLRRWLRLLQRSFTSAFYDNCFSLAKGAAYSSLLSFFPLLTTTAAILVEARATFVLRTLQQLLRRVLPPGTEEAVLDHLTVRGKHSVLLLVFATLLSAMAGSGAVKSLMQGFQAAYRVAARRSYWRETGVAVLLVLAAALPLLSASALVLFGRQTEEVVLRWLGADGPVTGFWLVVTRITRYAAAFSAATLMAAILYRFGPLRKQRWRRVWPGAVLSTVFWLATTYAFAWYVRNLANYNLLYGSIGTSIALLVWMYLTAAIILVGCEFNALRERQAGPSA